MLVLAGLECAAFDTNRHIPYPLTSLAGFCFPFVNVFFKFTDNLPSGHETSSAIEQCCQTICVCALQRIEENVKASVHFN